MALEDDLISMDGWMRFDAKYNPSGEEEIFEGGSFCKILCKEGDLACCFVPHVQPNLAEGKIFAYGVTFGGDYEPGVYPVYESSSKNILVLENSLGPLSGNIFEGDLFQDIYAKMFNDFVSPDYFLGDEIYFPWVDMTKELRGNPSAIKGIFGSKFIEETKTGEDVRDEDDHYRNETEKDGKWDKQQGDDEDGFFPGDEWKKN